LARRKGRVLLTRGFERDLERIDRFLASLGGSGALDALIEDLERRVIPILERTPRIGTRLVERQLPPDSALLLERIQQRLGNQEARTLVLSDFVLLYLVADEAVFLLSVRHQREHGFRFGGDR
jgi:plasmid stabilization system protein ParE